MKYMKRKVENLFLYDRVSYFIVFTQTQLHNTTFSTKMDSQLFLFTVSSYYMKTTKVRHLLMIVCNREKYIYILNVPKSIS